MAQKSANFYLPSEWATGDEPMTGPQWRYLLLLEQRRDIHLPFLDIPQPDPPQVLTKAEASTIITLLENGQLPTQEYLRSVGHCQIRAPLKPSEIVDGDMPATACQKQFISELTSQLGDLLPNTDHMTKMQAALKIQTMKEQFARTKAAMRTQGTLAIAQGDVRIAAYPAGMQYDDIDPYYGDEEYEEYEAYEEYEEFEEDLGEEV
ncbi:hypothetical protein A0H81_13660 [Grifola frondosa]|uniref:Uncharacterized protein n=1 Tax=Grifola frondosa TaxID=5627 RepID=A0A1C7LNX2_GRIFR|nr:hypothetical protein A0H81_13660 [Grifola frondosa]